MTIFNGGIVGNRMIGYLSRINRVLQCCSIPSPIIIVGLTAQSGQNTAVRNASGQNTLSINVNYDKSY